MSVKMTEAEFDFNYFFMRRAYNEVHDMTYCMEIFLYNKCLKETVFID